MYAEIAIGFTLPLHFYEGLHDQVLALPDPGTPICVSYLYVCCSVGEWLFE